MCVIVLSKMPIFDTIDDIFVVFLQYYITKHCKYYITLFDNNFTRNPFGGLAGRDKNSRFSQ